MPTPKAYSMYRGDPGCLLRIGRHLRQPPEHLAGIALALVWRCRVVRAQTLDGVAQTGKVVGKNPGPHQRAHARIPQVLRLYPMAGQGGQPGAVDLHHPYVKSAIGVAIERMRTATGLLQGNGLEQIHRHAIALGRMLKAGSGLGGQACQHKKTSQDWK